MNEDVEEKKPPPKYSFNSWRLYMSFLIMFGLFTRTSMRANMAMAVVCMVNSSYTERTDFYKNVTENPRCAVSSAFTSEGTLNSDYRGDLPWTQDQINRLFSANFYGILTSVWMSGYFADKFDPKKIVLIATSNSVILTLLTPTLAKTSVWAIFGGRYLMGLGEGFIMPTVFSMASRWFPQNERASFAAIYTSGNQLGVILTMPIKSLGKFQKKKKHENPWKLVLTSRAFWVAIVAQLSFSFSVVLMQSYLPLFMKQVLKISLKKNGFFSVLPFIMQVITKNAVGNIGDSLKKKGIITNTQAVRMFQVFANVGTASCFLVIAFFVDCDTIPLAIVVLAAYGCFVSCGILGFYTSLLSIAPRFSGTVGSMSLFIASINHSCIPLLVGFFNKNGTREEWRNIWFFAAFLHCLGAIVFGNFGTAEIQEWAKPTPEIDVEEKIQLEEADERKETDDL
ncbi:hypothetical protein FO519_007629 [Halicephalobus sp. NKZ332]|nr:hypothetical protein FO519_007629 [Halicephalobus sp. NKZ332]